MSSLLRPFLIILSVLLLTLACFVLFARNFETEIIEWIERDRHPAQLAALVSLLLCADIFIPIPSSGLITYASGTLGIGWGTLSAWVGLTLAATVGFLLTKLFGDVFVRWMIKEEELDEVKQVAREFSTVSLIVTRPLPTLGEACVLLMGMIGLPWRRFLPVVMLSNLVIAITYATIGHVSAAQDILWIAVVISAVLPLVLLILFRKLILSRLPQSSNSESAASMAERVGSDG